jgi:hypothetical protein
MPAVTDSHFKDILSIGPVHSPSFFTLPAA